MESVIWGEMMIPLRVLYVNGGIMNRGGIESYMMNYCRRFNKEKVQVDFIMHGFEEGIYDSEIKTLGGKIYSVPIKSKNYIGNIRALNKIFSTGVYTIVHSHMDAMSYPVLREAYKCGIPVRIAHSHNTGHLTNNRMKILLNEYCRKNLNDYATHRFACSAAAGKWLFGEGHGKSSEIILAKNAIDISKYSYNKQTRNRLRKELGTDDKFVIGHIGRFAYQKNHDQLIDIFHEITKRTNNTVLLLIGSGNLEETVKGKVRDLGLEDKVVFLGMVDNVHEYLNAFDVFLLPSCFEGLPVTLIEAQINSVRCVVSDVITKEAKISGNVNFVSLAQPSSVWADIVLKDQTRDRVRYPISETGLIDYDIDIQAKLLEDFYLELHSEL